VNNIFEVGTVNIIWNISSYSAILIRLALVSYQTINTRMLDLYNSKSFNGICEI